MMPVWLKPGGKTKISQVRRQCGTRDRWTLGTMQVWENPGTAPAKSKSVRHGHNATTRAR